MNRKSTYSAFTLVEMLIVMGIVVILMAVGITAGRYAINRANDVAHRNAVDQIYQALQAYYADERAFPVDADCGGATCTPQLLVGTGASGVLAKYMDSGTFDGGTDATYFYSVDSLGQSVLVCVTLGGLGDETDQGIYCNGNGFNDTNLLTGAITDKDIEVPADNAQCALVAVTANGSNWTPDGTSQWGAATATSCDAS